MKWRLLEWKQATGAAAKIRLRSKGIRITWANPEGEGLCYLDQGLQTIDKASTKKKSPVQ